MWPIPLSRRYGILYFRKKYAYNKTISLKNTGKKQGIGTQKCTLDDEWRALFLTRFIGF